jgi:hypothetical protein
LKITSTLPPVTLISNSLSVGRFILASIGLADKLRQFSNIHSDPPCLVFGEQFRRRPPPRLVLEMDIRKRLSVVVAAHKPDGKSSNLTELGLSHFSRRMKIPLEYCVMCCARLRQP